MLRLLNDKKVIIMQVIVRLVLYGLNKLLVKVNVEKILGKMIKISDNQIRRF